MKRLLAYLLVFVPSMALPCGGYDYSDEYFYYNLFSQTNISTSAYHSFLREDDELFYHDGTTFHRSQGNLDQWQDLLKDWSIEKIKRALYKNDQSVWRGKTSALASEIKAYMKFARGCSDEVSFRARYSWDYQDHQQNNTFNPAELLDQGNRLFGNTSNLQLKIRYAYQIIRLLHYSNQYSEAVAFYENKVVPLQGKGEIYYYLLDQIAGCYYSLKDYEKAAYLFLKVFDGSLDRKESAFISYRFCRNHNAEGKSYFSTDKDKGAYVLMRSLTSFSEGIEGLNELYALMPGDEKVELLFMRALNNVERKVMPSYQGITGTGLPALNDRRFDSISALSKIVNNALTSPKVVNKEFWRLSKSYLAFLQEDLDEAKLVLREVKGTKYKSQIEILSKIYRIFSWKSISLEAEKEVVQILSDEPVPGMQEPFSEDYSNWKHAALDHISHLYYVNNELAKAFLVHNQIENVERVASLELLDDIIRLVDKPNKTQLEKWLINDRVLRDATNEELAAYLKQIKAHYFLQRGDNEKARQLLAEAKRVRLKTYGTRLDDKVSARIFSNNTKECYDCEETEVMVDSVFLAGVFSFLKPDFDRENMAINLLKLDSLTNNEKTWKRKLAHYLLGNYYFNVSNTGYFRGTLKGIISNANQFPFPDKDTKTAEDMIGEGEGYNLLYIDQYEKQYHALAEKAMHHYQEVLKLSTDRELNARCLYMMAKCELNTYYNTVHMNSYRDYKGGIENGAGDFKHSFETLKHDYSNTRFYKMIIKECSFFRYYVNL